LHVYQLAKILYNASNVAEILFQNLLTEVWPNSGILSGSEFQMS